MFSSTISLGKAESTSVVVTVRDGAGAPAPKGTRICLSTTHGLIFVDELGKDTPVVTSCVSTSNDIGQLLGKLRPAANRDRSGASLIHGWIRFSHGADYRLALQYSFLPDYRPGKGKFGHPGLENQGLPYPAFSYVQPERRFSPFLTVFPNPDLIQVSSIARRLLRLYSFPRPPKIVGLPN